jgi:hypothetical protein
MSSLTAGTQFDISVDHGANGFVSNAQVERTTSKTALDSGPQGGGCRACGWTSADIGVVDHRQTDSAASNAARPPSATDDGLT